MDIINLLPDALANQIAAGEVVQRPASVVKELLENSVDAGSSEITVSVHEAGMAGIQVVDNGKGMSATDARICFERHATSKIQTADDLEAIVTMGFRGEALASIAAVSEVTLITRREEDELGTRLTLTASQLLEQAPHPAPKGSNFYVRNLFYNVPARRRFLKSVSVEMKHIVAEFQRVALANPQIAMTLQHDGASLYALPPSNRFQRVVNLFGSRIEKSLIPVNVDTKTLAIDGYVGKPESAKRRGGEQFMFVNGRYMRNAYFNRAIINAFEKLIPPDATPIFFLHFTLDPTTIDVNVHPTKTEVKFEDERLIWQILHASIREALAKYGGFPLIDFSPDIMRDLPFYPKSAPVIKPEILVDKSYNPFFELDVQLGAISKPSDGIRQTPGIKIESLPPAPQQSDDSLIPVSELPLSPRSVLQFNASYLVAPTKSGLAIIDQHRAHARIIYECLCQNPPSSATAQQLLFPVIFELTPDKIIEAKAFQQKAEMFGFVFKIEGDKSIQILALPSGISPANPESLFYTLLNQFSSDEEDVQELINRKHLATLAFASATPRNTSLLPEETLSIIQRLFQCEQPTVDPIQRPTLQIVSDELLSSWFNIRKS